LVKTCFTLARCFASGWAWTRVCTDTFATPLAVIILVGFIAALVYNFFRRKLDSFENLAITFRAGLWVVYCAVVYLFALRADQPALLAPMYIPALWGYTSWGMLLLKRIAAKRVRMAVAAYLYC
jgi:hypothetical protein